MGRMISRQEAAVLLEVDCQTVSNWVAKGVIKGRKVDGRVMVDKQTITRFFDDLKDLAATESSIRRTKSELEQNERELKMGLRDAVNARKVLGEGIPREVFKDLLWAIIEVAGQDVLDVRESDILRRIVDGASLEDVSLRYVISKYQVALVARRAIRKVSSMRSFSELRRDNRQLGRENEDCQRAILHLQGRIRELEDALSIREASLEKYGRKLGTNGGEMTELFNTKLDDTGLSMRCLNGLRAGDVRTIGDLVKLARKDVANFRNLGGRSLAELDDLVEMTGLEWGMDVDAIVAADLWKKAMGQKDATHDMAKAKQEGNESCANQQIS